MARICVCVFVLALVFSAWAASPPTTLDEADRSPKATLLQASEDVSNEDTHVRVRSVSEKEVPRNTEKPKTEKGDKSEGVSYMIAALLALG